MAKELELLISYLKSKYGGSTGFKFHTVGMEKGILDFYNNNFPWFLDEGEYVVSDTFERNFVRALKSKFSFVREVIFESGKPKMVSIETKIGIKKSFKSDAAEKKRDAAYKKRTKSTSGEIFGTRSAKF